MTQSIKTKASHIFGIFTKRPIIEMVQFLVDERVDAQLLHQLKLMDKKNHKNLHIQSYGEKVMITYERLCKVLVTYPSLEFKNQALGITKDKEGYFLEEYFGDDRYIPLPVAKQLMEIANLALNTILEEHPKCAELIRAVVLVHDDIDLLDMFIEEITGQSMRSIIDQHMIDTFPSN